MIPATDLDVVYRYHDGTKHHFNAFARSLGYLDWASQPQPFRSFEGAAAQPVYPAPGASPPAHPPAEVSYDSLFDAGEGHGPSPGRELGAADIGGLLRYSLGLSAWKQFRESRWSLRVNPSSGNLHPTEAYVVCGGIAGLSEVPAVFHYAPDRHALELRCLLDAAEWRAACAGERDLFFVALTSIHWRESWKYGERAFRYCQHDLGHAVAALSLAAGMAGRRARVLAGWSQSDVAALTGVDREGDFAEREREEPACLIRIARSRLPEGLADDAGSRLAAAARRGRWTGRASQLSADHVQWTFIDEVAAATRDSGRSAASSGNSAGSNAGGTHVGPGGRPARAIDARLIVRQRRSALAFDGRSTISRAAFLWMLARAMPGPHAPWDALWWRPRIHLVLFVHRVDDVDPGLYVLPREAPEPPEGGRVLAQMRAAFDPEFVWERAHDELPLMRLASGDCRRLAQRLSCDQEIASDGYFSFAMIAEFDESLAEFGASFYRHLFWEAGVVGQVMYLEAEAAGARATGIGCFYDDPVHDMLGLRGHAFQSLYHFTVGTPVADARLTTEPGYSWES